jgi:hypothetical protein
LDELKPARLAGQRRKLAFALLLDRQQNVGCLPLLVLAIANYLLAA